MAFVTIAALLAPVMLMAQSADACMTGGGAPGSLAAGPGAKGAQRYPIAGGSHPVSLLVTILEVKAGKGTASIYADARLLAHRLRTGHAQAVTGREIWISADPDVAIRYCLRFAR